MRRIYIRRREILTALVLASFLAGNLQGCAPSDPSVPDDASAEASTEAVFVQNEQECRTDAIARHKVYAEGLSEYQAGRVDEEPVKPMDAGECSSFLEAARLEHQSNAPIYATEDECEAEGVQCVPAATGQGYYPEFGGAFYDPYDGNDYVIIGGSRRVYRPSVVYLSRSPGYIVTPYGRSITRPTVVPGRSVLVPAHTRFAAPARPAGVAAKGTLHGRGSSGFGSTFKATGRGGIGK